jgi:hypothetical protein
MIIRKHTGLGLSLTFVLILVGVFEDRHRLVVKHTNLGLPNNLPAIL